MKAIHIVNITLGLLVLILIFLNLREEESGYQPLTAMNAGSISTITIKSKQRTLQFQKQDNWHLSPPSDKPVNQETIKKLLGISRTHSHRKFENTPTNRKAFSLEQPAYQISLDNTDILFGSTEPVQQLRYVQVEDRIHLINDLYLQFLLADEGFFTSMEE